MDQRRAFTVIGLLVVIAIIALLMGQAAVHDRPAQQRDQSGLHGWLIAKNRADRPVEPQV